MHSENETPSYTYLRFHLNTAELDDGCRRRLEQLGIECVQEGGSYEAYGIVEESTELAEVVADDPDITAVERAAPPTGF